MSSIKIVVYDLVSNSFCVDVDDGKLLYDLLNDKFKAEQVIALDFQNIEMITPTFLNIAIGQLYRNFTAEFIRAHLTVVNMLPEDMALLKRVVDTAKLFYSDHERLQNSINEISGYYLQM